MQRTKSLRLLHKQLTKDSAMSGQGLPDYVLTFRKPGENKEPILGLLMDYAGDDPELQEHAYYSENWFERFSELTAQFLGGMDKNDPRVKRSIEIWQRYASPVWMDINMSDTAQFRHGREEDDERHVCPLQLDVYRRCFALWTNPHDVVLEPFSGTGGCGQVCNEMDRKYLGIELKSSYYKAQLENLFEME